MYGTLLIREMEQKENNNFEIPIRYRTYPRYDAMDIGTILRCLVSSVSSAFPLSHYLRW